MWSRAAFVSWARPSAIKLQLILGSKNSSYFFFFFFLGGGGKGKGKAVYEELAAVTLRRVLEQVLLVLLVHIVRTSESG